MIGLIILQIVLIALNAVFACAEIAVLSINETKLERMAEDGNRKARRLFRLTREPAKFLATIQVAITLSERRELHSFAVAVGTCELNASLFTH